MSMFHISPPTNTPISNNEISSILHTKPQNKSNESKINLKDDWMNPNLYIAISKLLAHSQMFSDLLNKVPPAAQQDNLQIYYPAICGKDNVDDYQKTVNTIDRYRYQLFLLSEDRKINKQFFNCFQNLSTTEFIKHVISLYDKASVAPIISIHSEISGLLFADQSVFRQFFCSRRFHTPQQTINAYDIEPEETPQSVVLNEIKNGPFLDSPEGIIFSFKNSSPTVTIDENIILPLQISYNGIQNVCERISAWSKSNAPKDKKKEVIEAYYNAFTCQNYSLFGVIEKSENGYTIQSKPSPDKEKIAVLYVAIK